MNRLLFAALALTFLVGCGDDSPVFPVADAARDTTAADTGTADSETADATPDALADTASDAQPETSEDSAGDAVADAPTSTVTFTLTNANPGEQSRWVQIVDGRGAAAWWNVMPDGALDEFYRAHSSCTLCSCDDRACDPCVPEPTTLELAPGESVTGTWDGTIFEVDSDNFCEQQAPNEATQFQVEFVWSPVPPDATGALPPGTLSRTRRSFTLGVDTEVVYRIEALGGE